MEQTPAADVAKRETDTATKARSWRGIRFDSIFWGMLAVALSGMSAYLTSVISTIEHSSSHESLMLGIVGTATGKLPDLQLISHDADTKLLFTYVYDNVKRIRLGPFPPGYSLECNYGELSYNRDLYNLEWRTNPTPLVVDKLLISNHEKTGNTLADANYHSFLIKVDEIASPTNNTVVDSPKPAPRPRLIQDIVCSTQIKTAKESYTSRSLRIILNTFSPFDKEYGIEAKSFGAGQLVMYAPLNVRLTSDDASQIIYTTNERTGVAFTGGAIGGQAYENEFVPLRFAWESASATAFRDVILVVIGSFIALAAACAIEGLRPYVDGIAHYRNPSLKALVAQQTASPPARDGSGDRV